jgi:hypothetical protein
MLRVAGIPAHNSPHAHGVFQKKEPSKKADRVHGPYFSRVLANLLNLPSSASGQQTTTFFHLKLKKIKMNNTPKKRSERHMSAPKNVCSREAKGIDIVTDI